MLLFVRSFFTLRDYLPEWMQSSPLVQMVTLPWARLLSMMSSMFSSSNWREGCKEVKVLAANSGSNANRGILGGGATLDILSNSAWRNLRWTQEEQWKTVVKGATLEQVIDALGKPPRTVKSLRPQVDLVYFYETSIGDKHGLNGKVSFRKDKVIAVIKPDFSKNNARR